MSLPPPPRHRAASNGDTVALSDTNADAKRSANANPDKPTGNGGAAARQEGADIPPNNKQIEQPDANQVALPKSHKQDDKTHTHTQESKHADKVQSKQTNKQDSKHVDKGESKQTNKQDGKHADKGESKQTNKQDSKHVDKGESKQTDKVANKQDGPSANKLDKLVDRKEDTQLATNGGDASVQENGERRKPDTNYSVTRVKISPYRRGRGGSPGNLPQGSPGNLPQGSPGNLPQGSPGNLPQGSPGNSLADESLGDCSTQANYAGNDSTMQAEVSAGSGDETPRGHVTAGSRAETPRGVRSVRGRASYRALPELSLRHSGLRPTAPVVGRKRAGPPPPPHVKRARLVQCLGVNSDLDVCGPAGTELGSLKATLQRDRRDRRCRIM